MDSPRSPLRFRFRTLIWDPPGVEDDPRIGDPGESGYVEAADLGTAVANVALVA